jgi:hypothetical protein|tara:strand:- start:99 stop:515 length:417 start_codon:yes stop_codon:yes gene_type:complete
MVDLRPLTENDLPFLLEVRNDKSTRQFLENNSMFTLKESLKWFRDNQPKWFVIKMDTTSVGYIRTNGDEVGCDIHPNFRKKGYAKMAYELYLQDKNYASLWVFEDNFAVKLYKKLGFTSTENSKMVRKRNYIKMEYHG